MNKRSAVIAGPHAGGLEPLDQRERRLCVVGADRPAETLGEVLNHLFKRSGEPPVAVKVLNQELGELADFGRARKEAELFEQVFLQRLRTGGHVRHCIVLLVHLFGNAVGGRP